ncbi:hypothetical protein XENOCAPTIV_008178 [Xenoophorus captivus]|uniref:Uncharacterized protein n=1 Tax=Xenoophorus captivus TaxID=1517983 RepID=A0ABV0S2G8_9TELE
MFRSRCAIFLSRPHICCSHVPVRGPTGQRHSVQSGPVPFPAPGTCYLPLETTNSRVNPQTAVDLGSSHSEAGMMSLQVVFVVVLPVLSICSTGELPPGTVLGLTVDDPRLTLPQKKVKAEPFVSQVQVMIVCLSKKRVVSISVDHVRLGGFCCTAFSFLFRNVPGFLPFLTLMELPSQDHSLRLCVSSEADEEKRRELMMRGVPQQCCQSFLWDQSVRDNVTDNKISEQELNRTKSELLVPGSRLSPTPPQGRVYRGVRVAGLHMSLKHSQNKAAPHFPHDYPDCPAGARFQEEQEAEFLDKFRRKSLRLLSAWCRPTASKGKRQRPGAAVPPLTPSAVTSFNAAHRMSLLWVRLTLLSKGNPEAHAMVCVPTAEDLKLFSKDKAGSGPQEPPHKDHFKSRIKRKKKSSKKAATSLFSSDDRASDPITPKDPQSSSDLILGLWPDPLPSVTSHCSRVTLGWITQGDFSLSMGCGEALGFVSVAGLLNTLLNQPVEHRGKLLLRNPTSLHYRFVKLNIDV